MHGDLCNIQMIQLPDTFHAEIIVVVVSVCDVGSCPLSWNLTLPLQSAVVRDLRLDLYPF